MSEVTQIIPMSFIRMRTDKDGVEAFFMYSEGREQGPGIIRDGQGEPWMRGPAPDYTKITNPIEQRRGSWLIDATEAKDIEQTGIAAQVTVSDTLRQEWLDELNRTPVYLEEFMTRHSDFDIVAMQGCGNVTMNDWFVAYLRSDFSKYEIRDGQRSSLPRSGIRCLGLKEEPFDKRIYSCLVKRRATHNPCAPRYSIEDLKFDLCGGKVFRRRAEVPSRPVEKAEGSDTKTPEYESWNDDSENIEFAVFGQRVVENSQLVDLSRIGTQFADIRHLYRLPNINPPQTLPAKIGQETIGQQSRPRILFGEARGYDVWFGEHEMTRPEKVDLLIHAATEPVILDTRFANMGADRGLIEAAFQLSGYTKISDQRFPPRTRGTWRWYTRDLVQVFLQRNVYAYTMLGLSNNGEIIIAAASGLAGRIGHTLEAMGQNIIGAGAANALLMDEGLDVFQWYNGEYRVRPGRGRIRALFIFARQNSKAEGPRRANEPKEESANTGAVGSEEHVAQSPNTQSRAHFERDKTRRSARG